MGALAADFAWTKEDDFKLKKAALRGVPLETLATGTVEFSKKFTFQELHDRWSAILYDPVVAAETSARMVEYDYSALVSLSDSDYLEEFEEYFYGPGKRKPRSLRRRYYAMRKRKRNHRLKFHDPIFLNASVTHNGIGNEEHPQNNEAAGHADMNLDVNQHTNGIENEEYPQNNEAAAHTDMNLDVNQHTNGSGNEEYPQNNEAAGNSDMNLDVNQHTNGVGNEEQPQNNEASGHTDKNLDVNQHTNGHGSGNEEYPQNSEAGGHADMNLDVNQHTNGFGDDTYIEESDEFKEIYDLLEAEGPELPIILNDQNINLHLDPIHVKEEQHSMATTSNDVFSGSVKLENEMCNDTHTNNYLMEISNTLFDLAMEDDELPLMDADGNVIDKSYIDGLSSLLLDSPNKDPNHDTTAVPTTPAGKLHTSVIICTLNTEDPDIPSNDDVFLLPFTSSYSMQTEVPKSSKSFKDSGSGWKREFKVPKPIPPKDKKQDHSRFSSPIIGSQFRSEVQENHRIKQEFSPSEDPFRVAVKSEQDIVLENDNSGSDIFPKLDAIIDNHEEHTLATIQEEETFHGIPSLELANPIPFIQQFPLEYDMSSLSDDDDIPNFSDVEAMILDEKLSEDEKKLFLDRIKSSETPQTQKYVNAVFQRGMIRLEQAAEAFLKRDLRSLEALAVFEGWHIKYYVKKPKILLGRATEDFIVDVDLGRNGCECKVSRRQAIIHIDPEGVFHIKNLSKYSVFVNNNELATNQSTNLPSSCLIEIRGMPFLFETNEDCIKRYVDSKNRV